MWVFFALSSALFLGMYDIFRKVSLKDNPVIPVLFLASATGAFIFLIPVILSFSGYIPEDNLFYVPPVTWKMHGLFFIKSVLVGSSWFLAYTAISMLPLTIVIPIRSTGPVWTLVGAMLIYSEKFSQLQWIGILTVLFFFYLFSLAGKHEGINFRKNKWIFYIVAATLLGSASSLYDKYLLANYSRMAMQSWFSIYMVIVLLPFVFFIWFPKRKQNKSFRLSPYIFLIGIFLSVSDFLYFYALSYPESLLAVVSVMRRSSVIISFISGALLFHEGNMRKKAIALAGILIGVILLVAGTI
ncbi:MAG: DMT family transporter [Bacteroidales bacterium]